MGKRYFKPKGQRTLKRKDLFLKTSLGGNPKRAKPKKSHRLSGKITFNTARKMVLGLKGQKAEKIRQMFERISKNPHAVNKLLEELKSGKKIVNAVKEVYIIFFRKF